MLGARQPHRRRQRVPLCCSILTPRHCPAPSSAPTQQRTSPHAVTPRARSSNQQRQPPSSSSSALTAIACFFHLHHRPHRPRARLDRRGHCGCCIVNAQPSQRLRLPQLVIETSQARRTLSTISVSVHHTWPVAAWHRHLSISSSPSASQEEPLASIAHQHGLATSTLATPLT